MITASVFCDDDDDYRFGFNGQEKVNEIAGIGNHNTAQFWEYDTRLGRRWEIDPQFGKMPGVSPYSAFFNNPIIHPDKKGDFPGESFIYDMLNKTKGLIVVFNETHVAGGISGGYAYGISQGGRIYDKAGVTVFSAAGVAAGFTSDGNESLNVGVDVDLFDVGLFRHKTGKEGTDFLNGQTPIAVDVAVADFSFSNDGYGGSVGVGAGFGIGRLNYTKYQSYSMTKSEQKGLYKKMAVDEVLSTGNLSIGNKTDIKDDEGNVIGKRGELMLKTKGSIFSKKEKTVGTGIYMTNMSDDIKKEAWKSESYVEEKK